MPLDSSIILVILLASQGAVRQTDFVVGVDVRGDSATVFFIRSLTAESRRSSRSISSISRAQDKTSLL